MSLMVSSVQLLLYHMDKDVERCILFLQKSWKITTNKNLTDF